MADLTDLKIHIYADGADRAGIVDLYAKPYIKGLTTNPTLMRKAGVSNYEAFARDILEIVTQKPISFEVCADDFSEMEKQALKIASWGKNVFVKIPVTNASGESAAPLIERLVQQDVRINVTAILTLDQVRQVTRVLNPALPSVVSVFAGRIADTGRDPVTVMRETRKLLGELPHTQLLWASVREVLNILQAEQSGCDIVTVTHDILYKATRFLGMDLASLSLETVRMFTKDAADAGYRL